MTLFTKVIIVSLGNNAIFSNGIIKIEPVYKYALIAWGLDKDYQKNVIETNVGMALHHINFSNFRITSKEMLILFIKLLPSSKDKQTSDDIIMMYTNNNRFI